MRLDKRGPSEIASGIVAQSKTMSARIVAMIAAPENKTTAKRVASIHAASSPVVRSGAWYG